MSSPRWLSDTEQRAWRALQHFGAPLAAALNRQLLTDSALSTADYQVLVVLSETDGGVLRAGELGRATGWEKSRLSHHLRRMESRGLVRREECLTDGRGLLVVITEVGRQAIAQARQEGRELLLDRAVHLLYVQFPCLRPHVVGEEGGRRRDVAVDQVELCLRCQPETGSCCPERVQREVDPSCARAPRSRPAPRPASPAARPASRS